MTIELSEAQRKELARRYLDTAEAWLRRLIDQRLFSCFGSDYFSYTDESGTYLIKSKIRRDVIKRRQAQPNRYRRDIDATTFGQTIEIVCNPKLFGSYFKDALAGAYPNGREEARTFLRRLKSIRNQISHGSTCSTRDLEKSICYTNDLVDSLRAYFLEINMQRTFNVPTIVRFVDSKGNESNLEGVPENINSRIIDWRKNERGDLLPGERLTLEIEIDAAFSEDSYNVRWYVFGGERGDGPSAQLQIRNEHVGEQFEFRFEVVSNNDWHRFHGLDDGLCLIYRVLPPTG